MATGQISIRADVQQAVDALQRIDQALGKISSASAKTTESMRGIENSAKRVNSSLAAIRLDSLINLADRAFGGVQGLINLADAATLVQNKLRSVSPDAETAGKAFEAVGRIAQVTGQNFEAVGDLYQKIALQSSNLGLSTAEVTRITENFSKALVTTGTTGQAAASAIYQFGQSLGRGRVAYEDIRALQEASAATVSLIAGQFEMTGQQFVKAVQDGKISSEQLALAVNNLGSVVNPTFDQMNKTVGQSMENIRTSFILMIGNFEKSTGVFAATAKVLEFVAQNIDKVVVAGTAFMAVMAVANINAIARAFRALNLIMAANPMILLATVAAGIAVAIYDMVDGTEELNDASQEVLNTEEEIRGVQQARVGVAQELTKEQENAVKALESVIDRTRIQAQYQENILRLGERQADIERIVAEEKAKLVSVGIQLSQQDEQRLRNGIALEQSARRNVELAREQGQAYSTAFESGASAIERAQMQLATFNDQVRRGLTRSEIQKEMEQAFLTDPVMQQAARQRLEQAVNDEIGLAIGKYDKLTALRHTHNQKLRELDDILLKASLGTIQLEERQRRALENSRLEMTKEFNVQLLELQRKLQEDSLELTRRRINEELMLERSGLAKKLSIADQQALQQIGQNERQAAIVRERIEFEKKSELEKGQFALQQGAEIFNQLGTYNKRAFEAAKAFNIANAIMNTYMGATKALATYPPPFNFIAAAAVVASGLAQVAAIRGQQYSGRRLGGPVLGNTSYIVGENGPELFTPTTNGSITRNGDLNRSEPVTVNFNINANDATGFDDLLIQRRGLITQMISDAMQERGQRSML